MAPASGNGRVAVGDVARKRGIADSDRGGEVCSSELRQRGWCGWEAKPTLLRKAGALLPLVRQRAIACLFLSALLVRFGHRFRRPPRHNRARGHRLDEHRQVAALSTGSAEHRARCTRSSNTVACGQQCEPQTLVRDGAKRGSRLAANGVRHCRRLLELGELGEVACVRLPFVRPLALDHQRSKLSGQSGLVRGWRWRRASREAIRTFVAALHGQSLALTAAEPRALATTTAQQAAVRLAARQTRQRWGAMKHGWLAVYDQNGPRAAAGTRFFWPKLYSLRYKAL